MRKILLVTMASAACRRATTSQKHFGPNYNPWDQRLCLVPDGDLFRTIRHGKADVVTDTIDRFTKTGIKLTSGEELQADIIITATGLNMQLFGGVTATANGAARRPDDRLMTYKGLMFSGVPNIVYHLRIHQRVVDAEGRPGVRVRLPAAELHGRQRL